MFVFWALGIYETYQSTRYTYGPFKKTVQNLNELRTYLENVIQVDPAIINDIVETMQFASQLPDQCHEYGTHPEPDQDSIIRFIERETIFVHTIKKSDGKIDVHWGGARITKGFRKYQIKTTESSFLFWSWETDRWAEYVPLTAREIDTLNQYLEDTINVTLENMKSSFRNGTFFDDPGTSIRSKIKKQVDPGLIKKERAGYLLSVHEPPPRRRTGTLVGGSVSTRPRGSPRPANSTRPYNSTRTPVHTLKVLSTKEIRTGVIAETLNDEGTGFAYVRPAGSSTTAGSSSSAGTTGTRPAAGTTGTTGTTGTRPPSGTTPRPVTRPPTRPRR